MQIETRCGPLEVKSFGPSNGEPIVLIRGLGSQLIHWPQEMIDSLADCGLRVIVFDNRDIGKSMRCPHQSTPSDATAIRIELNSGRYPQPAYSLGDMAQDVVDLMDGLGLGAAHVLGTAMGGAIAQMVAINHPNRLKSLTLVMSAAHYRSPNMVALLLSYTRSREEEIDAQVEADLLWGSPGYAPDETYLRDLAERSYDRGFDHEGTNRQLLALGAAQDRSKLLARVNCPTLVLHGLDDILLPLSEGRHLARCIPGSEFQIISGMGHMITPALAPILAGMTCKFIKRNYRRQAA